jgi:hypothetical protein
LAAEPVGSLMPPGPNFFLVGAEKGASTSLHHYLRHHPEVFMTEDKNPGFFTRLDQDGPAEVDEEAYLARFEGSEGYPIRGEASTYLYRPEIPGLIHERVPEAKIAISLRDPVQRAYSAYWQCVAGGVVRERYGDVLDFTEIMEREVAAYDEGVDRIGLFDRSRYADAVARYRDTFGQDQVYVMLIDELADDAEQALRELVTFLGVDPDGVDEIALDEQQNTFEGVPYGGVIERVRTSPIVKRLAQAVVPKGVRDWLGNQVLMKEEAKPPVPDEARRLMADRLRSDVDELEDELERELPELRASFPEEG